MSRTLAIALEAVGICVVVSGIVIEATMHAALGFILITVGSALVASGALLWAKIIRRK